MRERGEKELTKKVPREWLRSSSSTTKGAAAVTKRVEDGHSGVEALTGRRENDRESCNYSFTITLNYSYRFVHICLIL